jgi:Tol biopolymer transport system component
MAVDLDSRFGPYQVLGPLGAGGMGQVFKALDPRLGREVALKVLKQDAAGDRDMQRRFLVEARAASALNHPNIVTVHDVGEEKGVAYIVTELVDGESVADMIERGPIPLRKCLDIAGQAAAGLAAAHEAGIVHRDVKPANIMVARSGVVKILDFGLAKPRVAAGPNDETRAAETMPGMVMGTAGYMSPEQALAQALDYRSDQFSLGLVLYRMLTGKAAFEGASPISTMAAIIEQEPRPISELNPAVPPPVRWCVERCLAKEPAQRYSSTSDLARELGQLAQRLAELSGSQAAAAVTAPPSKKQPRWIAPALALAVVVAWTAGRLTTPAGRVDLNAYELRPLASQSPFQSSAAWRGDGGNVAFIAEVDGVSQVFVRELASPMAAQITRGRSDCAQPFWSADGARVFFRQDGALWSVGSAGGAAEKIIDGVAEAAMSPDGKALALMRPASAQDSVELWLAGAGGAQPRRYEGGPASAPIAQAHLAWTRDGRSLGVWAERRDGSSEFWIVPYPSGTARKAFGLAQGDYAFSWMPDGRRIVFGGVLPGTLGSDLQFADTGNGSMQAITVGTLDAGEAAVSPRGDSIAVTMVNATSDLIEIPLDGSAARPLVAAARNESDPTWMHGSDQLAYATDRSGVPEIWLKSFQENWERPLITARDFPGVWVLAMNEPSFSPDDQRVAYAVRGSEGHAVWISNVRGGPPLRLISEKGNQRSPSWNQDGDWIAFLYLNNGKWTLAKASSGGAAKPIILRDNVRPMHPKWSRAGDWISCMTHDGLTLVKADGSTSRTLGGDWLVYGWDNDGTTLWGIRKSASGGRELTSVDAASGVAKAVGALDLPNHSSVGCFSMRRSDKAFAVSVYRPKADLWLLKGFAQTRSWWRRLLPGA